MKMQNHLVSAAIAAASLAPSSARPDTENKLNSAIPTQSPQPVTNTFELIESQHDSMTNAPTGAPFQLDEVNPCDKYFSPDYDKALEDCDNEIRRKWLVSEEYIETKERWESRSRWVVAGGFFTAVFGLFTCLPSPPGLRPDDVIDSKLAFLAITLGGAALLTAGLVTRPDPERAFSKFTDNMPVMPPSCMDADLILNECVEFSKETYGSLTHGHLRG